MPEMIEQKSASAGASLGSYGACKFSSTFPMEKPFDYKPLKSPSGHMFMTCMLTCM